MAYRRTSPQPIIEGGTNATSMATSNGAVFFDGTRLATIPAAAATINTGTNSLSISSDATNTTVNIGTGNAVKTVTLGELFNVGSVTNIYGRSGIAIQTNGGIIDITSNAGAISVSADNFSTTLNIGTGTGAAVKTVTVGSTTSTSVTTIACGTGGCNVGTSANAHTTTLGSTNTTSATTVQSGSGALNITSTNGAQTHNSGTGTMSISSDASATTVNIATGAAAKVVQLGSTNGASSLALRYGTADMTMASATGTVMSALDTGEITYPLQPAFLAYNTTTDTNATGAGGVVTCELDGEVFDQNGDFNTTTDTFTAPVTGKYQISAGIYLGNVLTANVSYLRLVASNRTFQLDNSSPIVQVDTGALYSMTGSALIDMDASDTLTLGVTCGGQATTVSILGGAASAQLTFMSGFLAC